MKIVYTAEAASSGQGRVGTARSSDGALEVTLARPKELGGTGEGTNPEQLFAAGYAACFHSAMLRVARDQQQAVADSTVTARVGLGQREDGPGFALAVDLHVALPTLAQEQAEALVAQAHQVCPYSNATRGNIPVALTVEGAASP